MLVLLLLCLFKRVLLVLEIGTRVGQALIKVEFIEFVTQVIVMGRYCREIA